MSNKKLAVFSKKKPFYSGTKEYGSGQVVQDNPRCLNWIRPTYQNAVTKASKIELTVLMLRKNHHSRRQNFILVIKCIFKI